MTYIHSWQYNFTNQLKCFLMARPLLVHNVKATQQRRHMPDADRVILKDV